MIQFRIHLVDRFLDIDVDVVKHLLVLLLQNYEQKCWPEERVW